VLSIRLQRCARHHSLRVICLRCTGITLTPVNDHREHPRYAYAAQGGNHGR